MESSSVFLLIACVVVNQYRVQCIQCVVGHQECDCGFDCGAVKTDSDVDNFYTLLKAKQCKEARPFVNMFGYKVVQCPRADDLCYHFLDVMTTNYTANPISLMSIGMCFTRGEGAEQYLYRAVDVPNDPSWNAERILAIRMNLKGIVFPSKGFLCGNIGWAQRTFKGVPIPGVGDYMVNCLCNKDLCNTGLVAMGAAAPPPPDTPVNEHKQIEELGRDRNRTKVEVTDVDPGGGGDGGGGISGGNSTGNIVNSSFIEDLHSRCGLNPDDEDCRNVKPGGRGGAPVGLLCAPVSPLLCLMILCYFWLKCFYVCRI